MPRQPDLFSFLGVGGISPRSQCDSRAARGTEEPIHTIGFGTTHVKRELSYRAEETRTCPASQRRGGWARGRRSLGLRTYA